MLLANALSKRYARLRITVPQEAGRGTSLAGTIAVCEELEARVIAVLESLGVALQISRGGEADLRVIRSEWRVESTSAVLHAGGWIRCPVAREAAAKLGVDTKQFGKLLNALEIKVRDCELGCF